MPHKKTKFALLAELALHKNRKKNCQQILQHTQLTIKLLSMASAAHKGYFGDQLKVRLVDSKGSGVIGGILGKENVVVRGISSVLDWTGRHLDFSNVRIATSKVNRGLLELAEKRLEHAIRELTAITEAITKTENELLTFTSEVT